MIAGRCVRADIVPEPCGKCRECERKRNQMITPLVHALKENGRIVDEAYVRHLRALPLETLAQVYTDWTQPRCVW